ncbi:transporter [Streptococcus suis]
MNLLLNNKLYNVLAVSRLLNSLGAHIYNLVFVIYAATQFRSTWAISVANIIMVLPTIFSFYMGIQADKTKKKANALFLAALVQTVLFFVMSFLLQSTTIGVFALVCVMNVITDLLSDYSSGLRLPIMQKNLKEDELMEAYSFFQFISCVSGIGGQALGVWLLSLTGNNFSIVAMLNACFFFISGILLYTHKKHLTHDEIEIVSSQSIKQQLSDVIDGIKVVFETNASGNLLTTLSCILLMNALGGALGSIYTIYFLDKSLFGMTYGQSLLTINAILVVSMIVGSLTPNDYFAKLSLTKMMICNAIALTGIGLSHLLGLSEFVGVVFLAFSAYIGGKVNPKIDSLLLANTSPELLARTDTLLTMLFTLSLPVGTILFSTLATIHIHLTWGMFAFIGLLATILAVQSQLAIEKSKLVST